MKDLRNDVFPNMSRLSWRNAPAPAPTGTMGGIQRRSNVMSNDLVESIAEITMSAGSMKPMEGGTVPKFHKATSYDDATGIQVMMAFGCNYRPNEDVTKKVSEMIVRAGIRQLGPIVSNLFLQPLRTDLNWHELAAKVADAALEATNNEFTVTTIDKNSSAEIAVRTFLKFESFNITPGSDDAQAYALPHDYETYVLALFEQIKSSPYRLGTVCTQGNLFKISFEQNVHDLLPEIRRQEEEEEFQNITNMLGQSRFG